MKDDPSWEEVTLHLGERGLNFAKVMGYAAFGFIVLIFGFIIWSHISAHNRFVEIDKEWDERENMVRNTLSDFEKTFEKRYAESHRESNASAD